MPPQELIGTYLNDEAVSIYGPPPGASTYLSDCWPSNFQSGVLGTTWYDPGICPESWTTAMSVYASQTMYAHCCPEGFKLLPDQLPSTFLPKSIATSDFTSDRFTYPVCYQALATSTKMEYEELNGEIIETTINKGRSLVAVPIRVKYAMTDFAQFPVGAQPTDLPEDAQKELDKLIADGSVTLGQNTRSSGGDESAPGRTTSGDLPQETSSSNTTIEPAGGSNVKIIAISVGVSVSGVIVLAILGYFFYNWRKKRIRRHSELFPKNAGPYHQQHDNHFGGIQDHPDETGGIALTEKGAWGGKRSQHR